MPTPSDFEGAALRVQQLARKPSNDDLLRLYGLYKQANVGDVQGTRPSLFDPKARAKFDAWSKLKGLTKERAQTDYIALVERLVAESS